MGPSLARLRIFWLCAVLALQGVPAFGQGALKPIQVDPTIGQRTQILRLEVFINDETTRQIQDFTFDPANGKLSAKRSEFEEAGVRVPGTGRPDEVIGVETLGVDWRFDETNQQIRFKLTDAQRLPKEYHGFKTEPPPAPSADPGFLVNYSLFGGSFRDNTTSKFQFSGGNASFDARAFSKFGVFSQTAIVGTTLYRQGANALRLDSTYTFSHQGTLLTGRAGDFISGGVNWSRPVRMGGIQIQRDFTLRSDIITRPVPVISGSAAVPSTVDVFVNGRKAFSQDVGSGPFRLSNLPLSSSSGDARVVVRDATGRETETSMPLTSPFKLLRPGLYDFSIEAGYARRNFGILSYDYDRRLLGLATFRRGITSWLTFEAHAEGGAGLANGGAGALVGLGKFGTLSAAGSFSQLRNKAGGNKGVQVFAGWEASIKGISVNIATQRTFKTYDDLASVTARIEPQTNAAIVPGGLLMPLPSSLFSASPLRALDRISFGAPLLFDKGSVNFSFIRSQQASGQRGRLVTLSYSRPLPYRGNLFVTAFADFGTIKSKGLYAGLNFPILDYAYSTAGVTFDPANGLSAFGEVSKAQPMQDNTYGWRVRDVEGKNPYRMAAGSYRSSYGQIGAQVSQLRDRFDGIATFDGSIAVMGGGIFAGNKVSNSFAVVDAGKPNVPILQDNREVGRTNMFGKKLVTDLRAYETNNIAVDPTGLPASYDVAATNAKVAPIGKAGVFIDFARQASTNSALIVLVGADGKFLKPGSQGRLNGGKEPFVVGYDGIAYLRNLSASNSIEVELEGGSCRANFTYRPAGNQQANIGKTACR